MPNWTTSMQQEFEFYTVNPNTWRDERLVNGVLSCTITRDSDSETLGSASMDMAEMIGERYIRVYLITIQNGVREKHPLGTFLIQTPSYKFDGFSPTISVDAYTPLIELKENPPPVGYYIPKKKNIMDEAYLLVRDNMRAPIVKAECPTELFYDFVADLGDTWITFISDLIANVKYTFDIDEMGRILFSPKQDTASLQPIWTYDDDNSSILLPDLSMDHDLYGIPNVVEVVYSNGADHYYAKVVNDDSNSPTSTVNRGRQIVHRVTDPELLGDPTQERVQDYAKQLLRELSTLEYTVTYKHGYCPVRVGDCIRLNHSSANLKNIKARVIQQTIECKHGCTVTEKAVFTNKLWG